jgi:serine/threonine protein kinase
MMPSSVNPRDTSPMPSTAADPVLEEPKSLADTVPVKELSKRLAADWIEPAALVRELLDRGLLSFAKIQELFQGLGKTLVIGPYLVLKNLGQGRSSQVVQVLDQLQNMTMALRIFSPQRLSPGSERFQQFLKDVQAAAQVTHANFVSLHQLDHLGGSYYAVQDYVEGTFLSKMVEESGPLRMDLSCNYIRQAASGLQFLHERGIVHRDIKPGHLIVTRSAIQAYPPSPGKSGTIPLKGISGYHSLPTGSSGGSRPDLSSAGLMVPHTAVVKILDLGLARLTEGLEGGVIGTPDYIAPEQARKSLQVDIRADLYSLGCTCYFLLTGRPPFPDGTVTKKLLMHQMEQPRPMEELRSGLSTELAAIVRKLMAKKPEERFQTPAELLQALATVTYKTSTASTVPVRASEKPKPIGPSSEPPSLPATIPLSELPKSVSQQKADEIATLRGHRGWVTAVAFSSDRELLASGGLEGGVRLWKFSSSTPEELSIPHGHQGGVNALAFSADNQLLASASTIPEGLVWLWDVKSHRPAKKATIPVPKICVETLVFSPKSELLAIACDKAILLWHVAGQSPRENSVLENAAGTVKTVAFSADSQLLASGHLDGTIRLWQTALAAAKTSIPIEGHRAAVLRVAFAPDGQALASVSQDQTVKVWDLSGPKPKERIALQGLTSLVRAIVFPPDGQTLLAAGDKGHAVLWDLTTGGKLREWSLPVKSMVASAVPTIDGRYIACGGMGAVSLFRLYPREKR